MALAHARGWYSVVDGEFWIVFHLASARDGALQHVVILVVDGACASRSQSDIESPDLVKDSPPEHHVGAPNPCQPRHWDRQYFRGLHLNQRQPGPKQRALRQPLGWQDLPLWQDPSTCSVCAP